MYCQHFKMEDIDCLRELLKDGDWGLKIDLQNAFNHIIVE
jgi:hypothetical protein